MRFKNSRMVSLVKLLAIWQGNVRDNFLRLRKEPLFQMRSCYNFTAMSITFVITFYKDNLLVKLLSFIPFFALCTIFLCLFDFRKREDM